MIVLILSSYNFDIINVLVTYNNIYGTVQFKYTHIITVVYAAITNWVQEM